MLSWESVIVTGFAEEDISNEVRGFYINVKEKVVHKIRIVEV